MKTPKPWFWTARKAWYVEIGGKQIKLHADQREATKEFYRLMARDGRLDDRQKRRMTFADAADAMISAKQVSLRPRTYGLYCYYFGILVEPFGSRRLEELRPAEVLHFIAGYKGPRRATFNDSTRYMLFRYVKALYRWAREMGYISINQFYSAECPWRCSVRARAMTPEEFGLIMGAAGVTDELKEVVSIMYWTGARPGEVACLHARHLDAAVPIARLKPQEYKTGGRTGLDREIILTPEIWERLRALAVERPQGPLLRDWKGVPWTQKRIASAFHWARTKLGMPADCVPYMARHAFITNLLEQGHPASLVARIVGHTSANVIQRVYYHPDTVNMIAAVGGSPGREVARRGEIRDRATKELLRLDEAGDDSGGA